MKIDKTNRRVFLQGLGGLMVAIPALPSLLDNAFAQASTAPYNKRFFTIVTRNQLNPYWIYNVPDATLTTATDHRWRNIGADLSTICPILNHPALAANSHRLAGKLSIVKGLNLGYLDHHHSGLLGNAAGSNFNSAYAAPYDWCLPERTIDVVIADATGISRDKILRIVNSEGNSLSADGTQFWAIGGLPVTNNANPFLIFQQHFTNVSTTPRSSLQAKRKIVDAILADVRNNIRGKAYISNTDSIALENHLDYMTDLENNYRQQGGTPAPRTCTVPTTNPNRNQNGNLWVNPNIDDFRRYVSDCVTLMAEAIKCNVFTLGHMGLMSTIVNQVIVNHESNNRVWHLNHAHNNERDNLIEGNRWVIQNVFIPLLQRLDVEEAGGRTFLDNSIIAFSPELCDGHATMDMPLILAGGGNGTVETGRYWDFGDTRPGKRISNHYGTQPLLLNVPYNRYWNSILQSWGLQRNQYEIPGRRGYGNTQHLTDQRNIGNQWGNPLISLINADSNDYYRDLEKPLPGLFKIPA